MTEIRDEWKMELRVKEYLSRPKILHLSGLFHGPRLALFTLPMGVECDYLPDQ